MISDALDLALLQQWVGKTETAHAPIAAGTARAMAATLDRADLPDTLPPLWHWLYFWSAAPQAQLGADGHAERGGFLPPVPLPRRMWAGGRLAFHVALPIDIDASRTSTVKQVDVKKGASGALAFVTVAHEVSVDGTLCISEEHDIVYRAAPVPGALPPAPKLAPQDATWSRTITPDPVLLFRYSALTFNGHRIHYDRAYVTDVEGYRGLVVHGPLIATLLADLVRRHLPGATMRSFDFRAVGPLFDTEPFTVNGRLDADGIHVHLWAANAHGVLAMQATASI
ncbi:FAS1-like dehydratase domain-containing protein [Massilia sp. S19_KUP03_FR1]|uniref:FAS1-like dehydratase domain-containing protein n=1 Tax=Massilia sp. S19_KUP03_FR1 TaxID=3025503 RepID=UPI002FCD8964